MNHDLTDKKQSITEEFSAKLFFLQVHGAIRVVRSRLWIIIICGVVLGMAIAVYSYFKKTRYEAEITFVIDEGSNKPANQVMAIAQQFTLEAGSPAEVIFGSANNVIQLMKSRSIIEGVLRKKTTFDTTQTYADFFLDSLQFREEWLPDTGKDSLDFTDLAASARLSLLQNSILKKMHGIIVKKMLTTELKEKGASVISAKMVSTHELFSKLFLEDLVSEVANYYTASKRTVAEDNLEKLQKRADSVRNAYIGKMTQRAQFRDAHLNPNLNITTVPEEKQVTDVQVLKNAYIGLMQSIETARTSLLMTTQLFQYIDKPVLPLNTVKPSLIIRFILGFAAGSIIVAAFFLGKAAYRKIMT
jgi:uncharacterized protein involved in exopolysaccharide biosynthesis